MILMTLFNRWRRDAPAALSMRMRLGILAAAVAAGVVSGSFLVFVLCALAGPRLVREYTRRTSATTAEATAPAAGRLDERGAQELSGSALVAALAAAHAAVLAHDRASAAGRTALSEHFSMLATEQARRTGTPVAGHSVAAVAATDAAQAWSAAPASRRWWTKATEALGASSMVRTLVALPLAGTVGAVVQGSSNVYIGFAAMVLAGVGIARSGTLDVVEWIRACGPRYRRPARRGARAPEGEPYVMFLDPERYPHLAPAAERTPDPEPDTAPEPQPDEEPEPELTPAPEEDSGPEPEADTQVLAPREPAPTAEPDTQVLAPQDPELTTRELYSAQLAQGGGQYGELRFDHHTVLEEGPSIEGEVAVGELTVSFCRRLFDTTTREEAAKNTRMRVVDPSTRKQEVYDGDEGRVVWARISAVVLHAVEQAGATDVAAAIRSDDEAWTWEHQRL